jgi:hypothetical protein
MESNKLNRPIIARRNCHTCNAEIIYRNQVAFINSLRRGATICRKCCGMRSRAVKKSRDCSETINDNSLPNFWKLIDQTQTGSMLH